MYGTFSYMYRKNQPNVGVYIYISYMDPIGNEKTLGDSHGFTILLPTFFSQSISNSHHTFGGNYTNQQPPNTILLSSNTVDGSIILHPPVHMVKNSHDLLGFITQVRVVWDVGTMSCGGPSTPREETPWVSLA